MSDSALTWSVVDFVGVVMAGSAPVVTIKIYFILLPSSLSVFTLLFAKILTSIQRTNLPWSREEIKFESQKKTWLKNFAVNGNDNSPFMNVEAMFPGRQSNNFNLNENSVSAWWLGESNVYKATRKKRDEYETLIWVPIWDLKDYLSHTSEHFIWKA